MDKVKNFISNNLTIVLVVVMGLMFIRGCSVNSTNKRLSRQVAEINLRLDSIQDAVHSTEYVELIVKKTMYQHAKLSLYDWNAIVRKNNVRPDDKIREYDDELRKIDEKLINLTTK